MTPLFSAKRAADEFDAVLDGRASGEVTARHADLLSAVTSLRAVPEVTPRPEFVEDLRSRLMLAAQAELVAAPPVVRRPVARRPDLRRPVVEPRRTGRRAGTVAAALVIVGGTAGMAAAASGALPGQALYPIKRGGEQISELVRVTEAGRGMALLEQAENRLDEVGALMSSGTADQSVVTETLDAFRADADQGSDKLFGAFQRDGDQSAITAVRSFTATQMATIDRLAATSDPQEAALLLDAADTLADIDQQARSQCGACGTSSALVTPASLSQGAAAASVDSLLARPATQAQADVTAAKLAALLAQSQKHAQQTADQTPAVPTTSAKPSTGSTSAAGDPVTNTLSKTGELLPGVKAGTRAVDDLVTDVSGATAEVSKGVAELGEQLGSAVDDATQGTKDSLTSTVDGVTRGLTP